MNRKLKNIVMIVFVILLLGTSIYTIYHIKNDSNSTHEMLPNMPNEKMDGNFNMEEPPEKKEVEDSSNDNSMATNEPPEIPDDSNNNEMINPQNINGMQPINGQNNSSNLSAVHYILFGIQSFGISLLVMYLIMSEFNKKTVKETLKTTDKITIYILSTIIITAGITFAEISITKKMTSNNSNNFMNDNTNGFMGENNNISYAGAKEILEDTELTSGEYTSSKADENAILVSGNIKATLENITISKTGDSDGGDNTSFYGINSGIVAKSGANLVIKNATITTDATGANGVFSYGGSATTNNASSDGTTVTISDSKITTTKDNSGGIMTTGGGITNTYNLTINTSGVSSAAIRTDRGGGNVNVYGGTYTTTGSGSPTVYSTAEITVKNANLVSTVAEGIVIEGKNSVVIDSCNLTDSNTKLNGLSTTYKNIFLYQSMSGDADTGNASFTANDSTITTNNGDSFYITNTTATINLTNNTIMNNDSNGNFLRAQADSWGNSGSNGGDVTLTLNNQNIVGNIVIDNISKLEMTMKANSYYEGIINGNNTAKSITLKLDKSSKIKLTGDSYVTSLDNEVDDNSNINSNGYKLYVNGNAIN